MSHERDYEAELDADSLSLWQEALARLAAGAPDAAEPALRALLARRPGFVPALNKLGVCRARAGDREGARRWFEQALAADARFVPALSNLGTLWLEAGDLDRAVDLFRQALAIDPTYSVARENLAAAYKRRGDVDAFVRELKRARRDELRRVLDRASEPEAEPGGRRGCLPATGAWALLLALLWAVLR